jgi:hypothetical protein
MAKTHTHPSKQLLQLWTELGMPLPLLLLIVVRAAPFLISILLFTAAAAAGGCRAPCTAAAQPSRRLLLVQALQDGHHLLRLLWPRVRRLELARGLLPVAGACCVWWCGCGQQEVQLPD